MTKLRIAALYTIFAAVASFANVALQNLVFLLYASKYAIYLAMPLGAALGLVIKFHLDRTYIFAGSGRRGRGQFLKYAGTGAALTSIFFAFELAFWEVTRDPLLRDVGALIGLAVGYKIKYELDKRIIFA